MALINDFLSLIYPVRCEACGNNLYRHESFLCTYCHLNLPRSDYHLRRNNELSRVFAGRVPMVHAASLYLFEKSGHVQQLLHAIKYQDQKELGAYLGRLYADELKKHACFSDVDVLIPVPLHSRKLKQRGYNQSEWFARGLAQSLEVQLNTKLLERTIETSTQTRKKKYQRWENVEHVFRLSNTQQLVDKHVMLIDDVITTGATIEAAWMVLKDVPGIRISVASIAFAAKQV